MLDRQFVDLPTALQQASPVESRANLVRAQILKKSPTVPAPRESVRIESAVGQMQRHKGAFRLQNVRHRRADPAIESVAAKILREGEANDDGEDHNGKNDNQEDCPDRA